MRFGRRLPVSRPEWYKLTFCRSRFDGTIVPVGRKPAGRARSNPTSFGYDIPPSLRNHHAASRHPSCGGGAFVSARSVARNYALALFSVAEKNGRADEVGAELAAFADLVAGHAEVRTAMESPVVSVAQKRAVVDALLERTGAGTETRRMFDLLAENDRLGLVDEVTAAYQARALEASGVVKAELVTAVAIGDDQQRALADALGRATGRRVDRSGRVDPEIIGGAVARVGSVVYDGSVTRQLERMRQRLTAGT